MTTTIILNCLLIILARMGDVSLGTLRSVSVIHGRRHLAMTLGFFEVLIWIFVVSKVVSAATLEPLYGLAYATGFAVGNFLGMTIERRLAMGQQVMRVFTRNPGAVATSLRMEGHRVTVFPGEGRDGPVWLLYIQTDRKLIKPLAARARDLDATCFYVVEDVRAVSSVSPDEESFWKGLIKFK